jgi:hypothetical protein
MEKSDLVLVQDTVNEEVINEQIVEPETDNTFFEDEEAASEEESSEEKQAGTIDAKALGEKLGQFFGKQVTEMKKVGKLVEGAGKDCFRQIEKEYDEYIEKAKIKEDKTKKKVTLERLYSEVGKIVYDGYKNGEDVDAVLKYFYKKIEKLEEASEETEAKEEKSE